MKFGIIGPSEEEIMPFIDEMDIEKIETFARLKFHCGKFNNIEVVALFCGVCKVNAAIATQILIDKFDVTDIIVTGVAGGIDKGLTIGDIVISTDVAYHDVDDGILTEYHPWMDSIYFKGDSRLLELCKRVLDEDIYYGKIVTGEGFISDKGRDEIIEKYNPLCVDMETASIAHVCYANDVPFLAIRSITDTECECGVEIFEDNCVSASMNSLAVLKVILTSID